MRHTGRVGVLEKRFGRPPDERKTLRVVEWRPGRGEPEPVAGPGEELLVIEIVDTGKARPAVEPPNGGPPSDDDLAAEIERLERQRDILKAKKRQ